MVVESDQEMRDLHNLDLFRVRDSFVLENFGTYGDAGNGAFIIPVPGQMVSLKVLASNGKGWDHISVSVLGQPRTPTWAEMEVAKKAFFGDVVAMQLHLTAKDHINCHPYTLHVWIPQNQKIPLPPKFMV
jgi:hypothetical protein